MISSATTECPVEVLISGDGFTAYITNRGKIKDENAPYDGFNICQYTGDSPEHIASCRKMLCDRLCVGNDSLIMPLQTHSTNIVTIDSLPINQKLLEGVDGLVTSLKDVVIGVSTADCVPVILADGKTGVIGVAHAGWRGAVGGVIENVIAEMVRSGADVKMIKAAMGPSICVGCFEVGEEVASEFPQCCVVRRKGWERPHVDLQRYVTDELVRCGVLKDNIMPFSPDNCTRCHSDKYFSARRLGIKSGRLHTFVKREA